MIRKVKSPSAVILCTSANGMFGWNQLYFMTNDDYLKLSSVLIDGLMGQLSSSSAAAFPKCALIAALTCDISCAQNMQKNLKHPRSSNVPENMQGS